MILKRQEQKSTHSPSDELYYPPLYYNKKVRKLILVLLLIAIVALSLSLVRKKVSHDLSQSEAVTLPTEAPSPTSIPIQKGSERTSLFVPYWDVDNIPDQYNQLIYFGITPTAHGVNTEELGYKKIETFLKNAPPDSQKLLALRMLDSTDNFAIIENAHNRQAVIDQTIQTATGSGFSGVVLDLEISAIPFDSVIKNINTFIGEFADEAKKNDLRFSVAIYGDTFYRLRPFDLKSIGKKADQVMIMAYDFNKARSNPGPNFPLSGKETFGYDFSTMVSDFSEKVPPSKLAVIFGMFGYDWEVDAHDKAVGTGKSLSYVDIKKAFIDSCSYKKCAWHRDEKAGEITVSYIDEHDKKHIVWFEDPLSVKRKEDLLKKSGISFYSFWANGYF